MPPIELTAQQEALLRLPEPNDFTQRLAKEIRRNVPKDVAHLTDAQLLDATRTSYDFAAYELHIIRIPTLVHWVKLDASSDGVLRRNQALVVKLRTAENPSLAAEDMLSMLLAQTN